MNLQLHVLPQLNFSCNQVSPRNINNTTNIKAIFSTFTQILLYDNSNSLHIRKLSLEKVFIVLVEHIFVSCDDFFLKEN